MIQTPLSRFSPPRRAVMAAVALLALAFGALAPAPASAQPLGAWFTMSGVPVHGYIRIPHSAALNPTNRFTFEAWVAVTDSGICSSIAGKGYLHTWWVGVCGTTLRSYLKGSPSLKNGGVVPAGTWTHIAVVFNGTRRIHYVNGEQVLNVAETGPLPTNSAEMRIGSDVDYQITPHGAIDEVRLWNVARSQAQIRQFINQRINTAQPGLVGVWALDGSGDDVVGSRDGSVQGAGTGFLTFPVAISCNPVVLRGVLPTSLCLQDRFVVTGKYRTGAPGTAETTESAPIPSTISSGVLAFPDPDTWQVLANVIDACASTGKFTVALSSPSSLFQRLEVFDIRAGVAKIYFRYPGPPAGPVVDTTSFATCP
ncbi:MAG TPA: LamG domain-containing protein [Thermoanaerobaculia bacterium]|nr:LamG domain-containing protein [Thermoanaerobaculia bacterium]